MLNMVLTARQLVLVVGVISLRKDVTQLRGVLAGSLTDRGGA